MERFEIGDRVSLTKEVANTRYANATKWQWDWRTRQGTVKRIGRYNTANVVVVWDGVKSEDQWPARALQKI
jgi:hypothetical protein